MKTIRVGLSRLLLLPLLLIAACATNAGRWDGTSKKMDAKALQSAVEKSFQDQQWLITASSPGATVAFKPGRGGQQTYADVQYGSNGDAGAFFHLVGKSQHKVNWLTFGILGLSMQHVARNVCVAWYEGWTKANPD